MKVEVGDQLPSWTLEEVRADRMRTTAAIFRDPNPIHWDREFSRQRGIDGRVVNQSPLNVGYVANMLMAWAGATSLRGLRVEFPAPVFDGDRVQAGGRVVAIRQKGDETLAECEVWLDRGDGTRAIQGTALVALPEEPE